MKPRLVLTLVCAALTAFNHPADAGPGDLDLTFGGTGKVMTDIGGNADEGYGVATQTDTAVQADIAIGLHDGWRRDQFSVQTTRHTLTHPPHIPTR